MDCINCGAPNPEDAIFCKKCGKRLDGMAVCPACGKLTPADGDFCINCGADKSAPPASVAVRLVPAPTPVNPAANAAASAQMDEAAASAVVGAGVAEEAVQEEGYMFEKRRGILKKVSALFAGLTALMGIIFVFLIECTMSVGTGGASASALSGQDIFYFFGDAYDVISSSLTKNAETVLTAGTLLGTLCCAFGMAITVICFLAAVSRMLKNTAARPKRDSSLPAPQLSSRSSAQQFCL